MQKLIIAGTTGKDAVLRRTGNGDAVLGFSLAVDNGKDKNGQKRETTWYDCSVWGKRAESLERYITKGTKLTLEGRPTVRAHEGKAYIGISVNDLTFQGGGDGNGQSQGYDSGSTGGDGYGAGGQPSGYDDSEIPFAPVTLI
ncbi:single-stranded DNA-binding protein [Sulfitobacter faviae]|uniref:single-stranded DNA-binding protein n=1 Tax=Sulfitobacter faviae TaxID=1775881 RepID=UPI00398D63BF